KPGPITLLFAQCRSKLCEGTGRNESWVRDDQRSLDTQAVQSIPQSRDGARPKYGGGGEGEGGDDSCRHWTRYFVSFGLRARARRTVFAARLSPRRRFSQSARNTIKFST